MRILILEDSDLLGPMLVRAFRRRGHEVVLCTNIASLTLTLQTMVDEMPDVILCDRELPDGDGWEWSYRNPTWVHEGDMSNPRFCYMSGNPKEPVSHPYYHKGINGLDTLFAMVERSEKG